MDRILERSQKSRTYGKRDRGRGFYSIFISFFKQKEEKIDFFKQK